MSTVYIASDYGKMFKKGETIQYFTQEGMRTTIFPYKTDQIVIIGNIEITSGALKYLMHCKIDVSFISKNGRFDGKLVFQEGKNVYLRQKQYRKIDDSVFTLKIVKSIVEGKLKNQLSFMQRIKRERNIEDKIGSTIIKMKENIERVKSGTTVEQVRGYEGVGSKYYFSIFKYNILQDWAIFNGRSMNPPEDNVNAVMSFIYTMISYRVDAMIEAEGLDPYVGYLHSLEYGRKSLIFDLMEEYRTPIADTLTTSMINLGILNENDFEYHNFSSDDDDLPLSNSFSEDNKNQILDGKKGVLLTKPGLNKVITQLEKKLDSVYFYPELGKSVPFKTIIREQIKHFKRVINDEESGYKPLLIK